MAEQKTLTLLPERHGRNQESSSGRVDEKGGAIVSNTIKGE